MAAPFPLDGLLRHSHDFLRLGAKRDTCLAERLGAEAVLVVLNKGHGLGRTRFRIDMMAQPIDLGD